MFGTDSKTCSRLAMACLLAFFVGLLPAQQGGSGNGVDPTRDCGAYCLGILFDLLGGPELSFDELRSAAQVNEGGYTSLLKLQQAVESHGFDAVAAEVTNAYPSSPVIAPMVAEFGNDGGYHFVVVQPTEGDKCVVYCPPLWVFESTWSKMTARFGATMLQCSAPADSGVADALRTTGIVLLCASVVVLLICSVGARRSVVGLLLMTSMVGVGCTKVEARSGVVRIEPSAFLDMGVVPAGNNTVEFQLINDSDQPALLTAASTSCSCAMVSPKPPVELAPGEVLDARVDINVMPKEARTVMLMYAFEHQPPVPVQVTLRGVLAGVEYEQRHYTKPGCPGDAVPFRVSCVVAPETVPLLFGDDPDAVGAWRAIEIGPVAITDHGRRELPGRPGSVELWAEGTVTSKLTVAGETHLNCKVGDVRIPFTVFWDFRPPADVSPKILVLDESEGRLSGSIDVAPKDAFVVASVESSVDDIACTVDATDGRYRIQVEAPASWAEESGHTCITINLENENGDQRSFPYTVVCSH